MRAPRYPIYIANRRFGELVALTKSARGNGFWHCACDCGNNKEIRASDLINGRTVSCGCTRYERMKATLAAKSHGMVDAPEYNSWLGMKSRCYNPKEANFKYYGAIGVTVCKEWQESFIAFFDHIGPKPHPNLSVDRWPNKFGNYEPGNVRWATQSQQMRNLRTTKLYTVRGKTLCLTAWAEEVGMSVQTLSARVHTHGWDFQRAVETPVILRQ